MPHPQKIKKTKKKNWICMLKKYLIYLHENVYIFIYSKASVLLTNKAHEGGLFGLSLELSFFEFSLLLL